MRTRRHFSEEFKREAVRMAYESGRTLTEVARQLEVRPDLIRRWRKKFLGSGESGLSPESAAEVMRLQRELSRLREERDILKKALAIFSEPQR